MHIINQICKEHGIRLSIQATTTCVNIEHRVVFFSANELRKHKLPINMGTAAILHEIGHIVAQTQDELIAWETAEIIATHYGIPMDRHWIRARDYGLRSHGVIN